MRYTALLLFVGLSISSHAYADWADMGVIYKCDKRSHLFSIKPLIETSSGVAISSQAGFNLISLGFTSKPVIKNLDCNLSDAKIKAKIRSEGEVIQVSLSINGEPIINSELFNSGLGFEPVLYQIDVVSRKATSSPLISLCRGIWSWEHNDDEGKCESLPLPLTNPSSGALKHAPYVKR